MLVSIEESLKAMREKQVAVNSSTQEVDLDKRQQGRWTAALRRRAKKVYEDQDEVRSVCDEAVEALKKGNYGGFTRNMELIQRLLLGILGNLEGREPDTGEGTQLDQQEVIEKIDRMLKAVENERKRLAENRNKKKQDQQQQPQGQPAPEPLVSKIAEMELVLEEQKALGEKIRNLGERAKEYNRDDLPDYFRKLYERYSAEQAALKKIWDDLRKGIPGGEEGR